MTLSVTALILLLVDGSWYRFLSVNDPVYLRRSIASTAVDVLLLSSNRTGSNLSSMASSIGSSTWKPVKTFLTNFSVSAIAHHDRVPNASSKYTMIKSVGQSSMASHARCSNEQTRNTTAPLVLILWLLVNSGRSIWIIMVVVTCSRKRSGMAWPNRRSPDVMTGSGLSTLYFR